MLFFFFSSRRRHTRCGRDWSSDVCSSDLDGTELDISATPLRLSAMPQKLTFSYSALNLAAPEAMRFQYRLTGHDSDWIDAGRSRQATFSSLPPGDYRFEVRALGVNGNLSLPDAADRKSDV